MINELSAVNIYNNDDLEIIAERILCSTESFINSSTQLIKIADSYGIKVFSADIDDDIAGMLRIEGGNYKIYINKNQPFTRQRFTVAHEIGHFILHNNFINQCHGSIFYRKDFNNYSPIEVQANYFAAALLMPRNSIIQAWNVFKDIKEVAKCFQVSTEAAYIRLSNLGAFNG